MMRLRAVVAALVLSCSLNFPADVKSADYFLSSSDGDDRLDGRSEARTGETGPFATLKRLESVFLRAGDRVLLKCGDRFSGPVTLRLSLLQTDLVTIGSYGDCDSVRRPTIDGRTPIAHSDDGKVIRLKTDTVIEQVFADGRPLLPARYPEDGYLIVPDGQPGLTESLLRLPQLEGKDLSGARLLARTQEWFIEARQIEPQDRRLDTALRYPLRPRTGFYMTGKTWMVSDRDAWAYDLTSKELVIRAPRDARLEIVPAGNLIEVTGKASLQISGIDFNASGEDALNVKLNGIVTIQNSTFRFATGNGISVSGAQMFAITDSRIQSTGLDGIFLAEVKKAFIKGNSVIDAGMLAHPKSSLAAINAHRTESATVIENSVVNSAYHGIRFAGDARIQRNYVRKSCRRLSDCAGIYTWRRNASDERPKAEVVGNLVVDVAGDTTVKLGVNDWFAGIYLDDFTNNVNVRDNVVAGANQGIYLHNAWASSATNNVIHARGLVLVDKADPVKVPKSLTEPNLVMNNFEFGGDYSFEVIRRDAADGEFSLEKASEFELRLSSATSTGEKEPRLISCEAMSPSTPPSATEELRSLIKVVICN